MLLVFALLPVPPAWARDPGRMQPMARAAILFAADGLRQDLVEEFVAEGALRTFGRLLEDMPAIDVENAWGLDATSYGNHEFDYGIDRLVRHQLRATFPFLAVNIVETRTGVEPFWVERSRVFEVNGVKVGVIGAGGTNVQQPGDALLDIVIDEIGIQSAPPSPGASAAVEGRIIGPSCDAAAVTIGAARPRGLGG
jgi:hypothetical protein